MGRPKSVILSSVVIMLALISLWFFVHSVWIANEAWFLANTRLVMFISGAFTLCLLIISMIIISSFPKDRTQKEVN